MTSSMALADIATLQAKGLRPTPEDIIRLNGLAIAVERAGDPDAASNAPRVVFLCNVAIHEPTLQAEIWLAEVAAKLASSKAAYDTLRVYACAHAIIPGFFRTSSMRSATLINLRVYSWSATNLWKATPRQISAALEYVTNGADPVEGEYPDLTGCHPNRLKHAPTTKENSLQRLIERCLAAGMTLADTECLTWSAASNILTRIFRANGGNLQDLTATPLGDYTLTVANIEQRLLAEKDK
jgi:hypothetical protein